MENARLDINYLPYYQLRDERFLHQVIYPDMYHNYYWSDDFSAEYYMAQARAGFIAVTEQFDGEELLIPEIQYSYALLDFEDLHISRKTKKVIEKVGLRLEITEDLEEVFVGINRYHKRSWFTPQYLRTLQATQSCYEDFQVIAAQIRRDGVVVAGEIGYIIGSTYTSLSGFSSKAKPFRNHGTAQLVLLGEYLDAEGFAFWNLGQPYMDYKLALGAKIYSRGAFLERWWEGILS